MNRYLKITIPCSTEVQEILIAELGQVSYDSFLELDNALEAYIKEEFYDGQLLLSVLKKHGISMKIDVEKLQDINWNEEWEKNFDPVYIDEKVQVRATFHKPQANYIHDVIINPKMAFGTGHHETTYLIIAEQLNIDHTNKRVLDVGTGTGVLSIMAYKLGAKPITATDIDDWCVDNCRENFDLNKVENFKILQGTINKLTLAKGYDIIYANINKNVLMEELSFYSALIRDNGILVLSGFYSEDIDDLAEKAIQNNLIVEHTTTRCNWAMMRLRPL